MEMKLYYVTNRNHEGKNQWKPKGYGIHPSTSGIENLRLGKVTLDAGANSFHSFLYWKSLLMKKLEFNF